MRVEIESKLNLYNTRSNARAVCILYPYIPDLFIHPQILSKIPSPKTPKKCYNYLGPAQEKAIHIPQLPNENRLYLTLL
jgi:hypothetical protein